MLLFGGQASRAVMPRLVVSTNAVSGEVKISFAVAEPSLQAGRGRLGGAQGERLRRFWRGISNDLKEDVTYGGPSVWQYWRDNVPTVTVASDPPGILLWGIGLVLLLAITFRFRSFK